MLELAMAAALTDEPPAVGLESLADLTDVHAA